MLMCTFAAAHLDVRCAGSDSCQPLALAKVAVYAQLVGALCDLALLVCNVVLYLVHVDCQVLEISSKGTCSIDSGCVTQGLTAREVVPALTCSGTA